jgi:hypothetical protein
MQNSHGSGLQHSNPSGGHCVLDNTTTSTTMDGPGRQESPGKANPRTSELSGVAAKERNRRRSSRREFKIFVRVYGRTLNGTAFYENARTLNVSVHGALLLLTAALSKGQKLLLFNEVTQRQQMCQIVDVRSEEMELHEVAVAFPTPHAEFWNAS